MGILWKRLFILEFYQIQVLWCGGIQLGTYTKKNYWCGDILQVFYENWDAAMANMKIEGQREGSLSSSELEGRNYLSYLT